MGDGLKMTKYLNHVEYNRWCRSYLLNFERFVVGVDAMRLALDELPGREEIESGLDKMEEKLENAVPRNFNIEGWPLTASEMFSENVKVIINLFYRALNLEEPFLGIYYTEKSRVLSIHQEFKSKEKFAELKDKVEKLLEKHQAIKEAEEAEMRKAEEAKKEEEKMNGEKKQEEGSMMNPG
jgi:hypothetical protein